jgi:hypothetical protein
LYYPFIEWWNDISYCLSKKNSTLNIIYGPIRTVHLSSIPIYVQINYYFTKMSK